MTNEDLQKLKEDVVTEINLLESELNKIAVKNPSIEGDYQATFEKLDNNATPEEKANNIMDYEERKAVEQNFEVRLKDLKEMLHRIDEGRYGVCDNCGLNIEERRLKAVAATKYCVDCATKKAKLI